MLFKEAAERKTLKIYLFRKLRNEEKQERQEQQQLANIYKVMFAFGAKKIAVDRKKGKKKFPVVIFFSLATFYFLNKKKFYLE